MGMNSLVEQDEKETILPFHKLEINEILESLLAICEAGFTRRVVHS